MKVLSKTRDTFVCSLICRNCRTCPQISIDLQKDLVTIDDDHGNQVSMTVENFQELVDSAKRQEYDEILSKV